MDIDLSYKNYIMKALGKLWADNPELRKANINVRTKFFIGLFLTANVGIYNVKQFNNNKIFI